ncbi:MAG: aldehyde dehydrogenase family protein [Burkholderiales bacterium]|nr:aldehyde dehydrogenase family protein [Burkholderiales bacterium]
MSAALAVRALAAGYGPIRVLEGLDLDVRAGRLTALVGPNGAGKTTLLKAITGLIARSGEVVFDGQALPPASPVAAVKRGIAHVPEGRQLFPLMTVAENLELGGYLAAKGERAARIEEVYAAFPKLAERRTQLAGTMSGGEQQMLAIGRALMSRPRLLVLDEPSLGLAPKMVEELLAMVRRICDRGVTVLLVEQNVAKALAIAEDAYVLERGRVALAGSARAVLESDQIRDAYLGAAAPGIPAKHHGGSVMSKETTAVKLVTDRPEPAAGRFASDNVWSERIFSGGWRAAKGGVREVIEPATGKVLTVTGRASPEDVRAAARAAAAAQAAWADTPGEERGAILRKAARILEANMDAMRPWIVRETGCVPPKADVELGFAVKVLNEAAGLATQPGGVVLPGSAKRMSFARRVPHGVVGVISPFNFPLILSIRAVAPALALGNTVVLKPDPQTPVTGGFFLAWVLEAAGLPADCLHVLPGEADAGEALIADPDVAMISFTGSSATGRRVGELAGRHLKKVTLELGGKNSTIVLDDADLDIAASNVAWGAYLHQGQICMATGKVIAHRKVAGELVERLAEKAKHLPVGDPAKEHVAIGPIINRRQLERVDAIVKETVAAGAIVRAGGTYENLFYRPTVLDQVRPGMRAFDEEVFGPVASVVSFASDDEAIALNNATEYGLSVGVITQSLERAMRFANRLRTGIVHVNDQTVGDEPWVPFGGRGASGNGGRHGGLANWEEFTQWQWVTIQDRATPYPF